MCSKHQTIYISRLTILSWTEWRKRFCCSMYGCWGIFECLWAVKGWVFLWVSWTNNSTIERDTTEGITKFHSESIAHSNDINISSCEKIPKINENPLIIDLVFHQNFVIFAMCLKHQTIHISRLTILSWTERYKRFCRSMNGCWDIIVWLKVWFWDFDVICDVFKIQHDWIQVNEITIKHFRESA